MRGDTHARVTLITALLLGLVPVRSWQRGEIDTATLAVRMSAAMAVTWAVLLVVSRVLAGYRSDRPERPARSPGRRAQDRVGASRAPLADQEG